jgi:hypothetical protein
MLFDVTDHHPAVDEVVLGDTVVQIRADGLRCVTHHDAPDSGSRTRSP